MRALAEALATAGLPPIALDHEYLTPEQSREWTQIVREWAPTMPQWGLLTDGVQRYIDGLAASASFAEPH